MTTLFIKLRLVPTRLAALRQETLGATAVEYGLLAALVAGGLAAGLGTLADLVQLLYQSIVDAVAT
jgi:Flp pilus assembly pilin Flp